MPEHFLLLRPAFLDSLLSPEERHRPKPMTQLMIQFTGLEKAQFIFIVRNEHIFGLPVMVKHHFVRFTPNS